MFKFGRYAQAKGPYDKYREPVSMVRGSRSTLVMANGPGFSGGGLSGGGSNSGFGGIGGGGAGGGPLGFGGANSNGYNVDRYNPVFDQLEEGTILEDWIPRDAAGLDLLFRRIYLRDPIVGPGIDIIKNLPWSEYVLKGIKDKSVLKIYQDTMDSLNIPLLMPDITGDHLIYGRNVISLIFDERKGIFSGVVPHDADFIRVSPLPVYGFDPLCDFKLSPGFRKFLLSPDPRAADARRALPPGFINAASSNQGFLPLDPVGTIYLARTAGQSDRIGTSLLTRVLYFWAIEKALLNAQMASTRRRSRSFVHVMAGIDNVWEPTPEELDALAGLIIQANEDPVGGVVSTRTGVTINEPVGSGQDFYKWSDELDLFSKYKMQAIGISEALLSGDATYNNAEQARSVFVENLATMRYRIVHQMFYQKLFPTLARLHGFTKRTKAELDHNVRVGKTEAYSHNRLPIWAQEQYSNYQGGLGRLTARKALQIPVSELIMPTIDWAKQLKPNQDEKYLEILEKLKNNDYPVTLKEWAQAAGLDPETIEQEANEDKKLRARLESFDAGSGGKSEEDLENGGAGVPDINTEEPGGEEPGSLAPPEEGGGEDSGIEMPKADQPTDVAPDVIVPEGINPAPPAEIQQMLEKVKSQSPDKLKGVL